MMEVSSNVLEFDDNLRAMINETQEKMVKVIRFIFTELARRVVEKTPVETGRAALNWDVTAGNPDDEVSNDATGSTEDAVEAMLAKLKGISFDPPDGVFWLYNNLEYIQALEFGLYSKDSDKVSGGFSIKAPNGMVRITIEEISNEQEELVRKALE